MDEELKKVKPKTRKSRRKCYASDDPSHVCSVNHVRVPAHCRVKRGKSKQVEKEPKLLSATNQTPEDYNVPLPAGRDISRNVL